VLDEFNFPVEIRMGSSDGGDIERLTVGDLMTAQVVVLEETTTLQEAIRTPETHRPG
jgi:CBS domain-containing protein